MAVNPLKVFETLDPELLKLVNNTRDFALAEGVIPKKYKILMAMALDASHVSVGGVTSLAKIAMQEGATKEEIAETLRVATYISGAVSVFTAGRALAELFKRTAKPKAVRRGT